MVANLSETLFYLGNLVLDSDIAGEAHILRCELQATSTTGFLTAGLMAMTGVAWL